MFLSTETSLSRGQRRRMLTNRPKRRSPEFIFVDPSGGFQAGGVRKGPGPRFGRKLVNFCRPGARPEGSEKLPLQFNFPGLLWHKYLQSACEARARTCSSNGPGRCTSSALPLSLSGSCLHRCPAVCKHAFYFVLVFPSPRASGEGPDCHLLEEIGGFG